jgi:hypothetical protein
VIQYQSAGVRERHLLDAAGAVTATWTYTTWEGWSRFHHISEERRTIVVSPEGNATVHYFRANSEKYGNAADLEIPVWDFGLPYTRRYTYDNDEIETDDELFLSVEHFDGTITSALGADPITGTRLRSTFVRYDKDELDRATCGVGVPPAGRVGGLHHGPQSAAVLPAFAPSSQNPRCRQPGMWSPLHVHLQV